MTLEAIGQKLKAAREAQGLSLRQIYERTKIPTNHLQSIDSGHPDDLPEPVYVAGFIKRYAESIGLDGQVLADEYRRDDSVTNGRPKPRPAATQVYVTPEYLKHTRIDRSPPSWKLLPFYAFGGIVVCGIISWISTHAAVPNTDPTTITTLKNTNLPAATSPAVPAVPGATQAGTAAVATQPPVVNDGKVTVSISSHVWLEVKKKSSNETIFMGFLEKGQTREFQDSEGIWMKAGEPSHLSVEFKGKIEPFGAPGKVAIRTFDMHDAVASSTTGQVSSPSAISSTGSSLASSSPKPKKIRRMADGSSASVATGMPRRRRLDGGYRSIGEEGSRSIEVPYRYSEGRLDAN